MPRDRKPDFAALVRAEQQFIQDSDHDQPGKDEGAPSGAAASARDAVFADLGSLDKAGSRHDQRMASSPAPGARHAAATQNIDQLFAAGWNSDA